MNIKNNQSIFDAMGTKYIQEDARWGDDLDIIQTAINKIESPIKYLDVGCGTGFHISKIAKLLPDAEITGMDFSQTMLDITTSELRKQDIHNVTLQNVDITKSDWDVNEKFNLITFLNGGLGNLHVENKNPSDIRKQAIKNISQHLDSNGYLILSVYNRDKIHTDYGSNLVIKAESDIKNGDLIVQYTINKQQTSIRFLFTLVY